MTLLLSKTNLYKVLHDYDAQRNDELSLKGGDQVRLIEQDNEEWCTAENVDSGQQGAVPLNLLEKLPSRPKPSTDTNVPVLAKVSQEYTAQDVDELSLWKNGIVTVLDQSIADGWWKGDLNGKSGIFPSDHVDIIDASQDQISGPDENDKTKRQSFKLAAYGVKQGGIGSILAGGFNLRKKGSKKETPPHQESTPVQQQQSEQSDNTKTDVNTIVADRREKAIVVSAYTPQNEDELQLLPGAYVTIVDGLDEEGWWRGVNEKGKKASFHQTLSKFYQIKIYLLGLCVLDLQLSKRTHNQLSRQSNPQQVWLNRLLYRLEIVAHHYQHDEPLSPIMKALQKHQHQHQHRDPAPYLQYLHDVRIRLSGINHLMVTSALHPFLSSLLIFLLHAKNSCIINTKHQHILAPLDLPTLVPATLLPLALHLLVWQKYQRHLENTLQNHCDPPNQIPTYPLSTTSLHHCKDLPTTTTPLLRIIYHHHVRQSDPYPPCQPDPT
ncbi:unnamed protein product [Absidia cylindrospora]